MDSSIRVVNKFRIVLSIVAIAPLWMMLAAASTSVYAQTSDDVSNSNASASSPADWTQFLRDNMQRWNPYETVLGINNVGGLQVKWKNSVGGYDAFHQSSPAVANGVVYFGSDDGNVYALNASTGEQLWSYTTEHGTYSNFVDSSPAVANGVVYVGSANGNLYALNANTGAKLWSFKTVNLGIAGNQVNSSPAVLNGAVYFGSEDGNVYALNASTGAKLWSYSTGGDVDSSPAVANAMVYIGSDDQNVYALNANTGALVWKYSTGFTFYSSPAVANGVVYVGGYNAVIALNANTGAKLWSYATGLFGSSSPAVANGVVYVGADAGNAAGTSKVYALNASTGALLWSYSNSSGLLYFSSSAVANGVVYITDTDAGSHNIGNIYALNASSGALLWSYYIGSADSSATVVNGVLYVRGGNNNPSGAGNVYAFSVGGEADLNMRIFPSKTTVHQGDMLTYAFPVWNLGPDVAEGEVLNTQVPAGTTFDYLRISGTPGLGTCTHPPYGGTGQIICHEGDGMAPNTTWTVRLTVKVTAPAGAVITANAATMSDTPDPNMANNTATVSLTVQ